MKKNTDKSEIKLLRLQLKNERKKNALLEEKIQMLTDSCAVDKLKNELDKLIIETKEIKNKYAEGLKEIRVLKNKYTKEMEKLIKHKEV